MRVHVRVHVCVCVVNSFIKSHSFPTSFHYPFVFIDILKGRKQERGGRGRENQKGEKWKWRGRE